MSDSQDFSLVLGGPLFQFFRRARLSDDALHLVKRRMAVISLFCWLPLLVLSFVEHHLLPGTTAVPFLQDIEIHVRFLVALPLLILAELVVHGRMRPLMQQFKVRDLIPQEAMARFDAAIASLKRLRNSIPAELILIALVYGVGVLVVWRQYFAMDAASWYNTPTSAGPALTLAGKWYGYVSLPIFQFILLRWYFRLLLWARFLWQVSRIRLKLVPTHPDHVGGIGFLSITVRAFVPLLVAQGALVAGQIANRIFFAGAALTDFKFEIGGLVVIVLLAVTGPLLVFVPQLALARRTGLREYGDLAQRYVREFDSKWLRGGAPADEPLMGSADIQSLADLGNSFGVVQGMNISPISRGMILQLAAATLAPFLPLVLTMMPLEELLKKLFGMLF